MLLKNTFSFIFIGFLPYAVNFALLPVYSNYLSRDDFGIVGIVSIFVAFAGVWSFLQLPSSIGRLYFDCGEDDKKIFFSSILLATLLSSLFFLFLYVVALDQITSLMFSNEGDFNLYILIASIQIVVLGINQVAERWLVAEKRATTLLMRNGLSQVVNVGSGVFFVVYLEMGVLGYLLAILIGQFVLLFLSVFLLREFITLSISLSIVKKSLSYSAPLVFHALGGVIFMYSSTFILEKLMPLSVVGVYVIADKFSQVVKVVVNQLNALIMPHYMGMAKKNEEKALLDLENLFPSWLALISIFILVFSVVCYHFIPVALGSEYKEAGLLVFILSAAYLFRGLYCFSSSVIFYRKETSKIPIITLGAGFFSVASNITLIPILGMFGAAISVLLSFVVSFVLAIAMSPADYRFSYSWALNIKIISVVVLFILFPLVVLLNFQWWISMIIAPVLGGGALVIMWYFDLFEFKKRTIYLKGKYEA